MNEIPAEPRNPSETHTPTTYRIRFSQANSAQPVEATAQAGEGRREVSVNVALNVEQLNFNEGLDRVLSTAVEGDSIGIAVAEAVNGSTATASAEVGSRASATATDDSRSRAVSSLGAAASSAADDGSSAVAYARRNAGAAATADDASTARATARRDSIAVAGADDGSQATATARRASSATSSADNQAHSSATAIASGLATSTAGENSLATSAAFNGSSSNALGFQGSVSVAGADLGSRSQAESVNGSAAGALATGASVATARASDGSVAASAALALGTAESAAGQGSIAGAGAAQGSSARAIAANGETRLVLSGPGLEGPLGQSLAQASPPLPGQASGPEGDLAPTPAPEDAPRARDATEHALSTIDEINRGLADGSVRLVSAGPDDLVFETVERGENPAVRVAVIDDFVPETNAANTRTDGSQFNHGATIDRIIQGGGAVTNGTVQDAQAPVIETVRYNVDVPGQNRTEQIAAATDDVVARLRAGEDFDAVNISQQDFSPSPAGDRIRQNVQVIQDEFGVPVVAAAGNNPGQTSVLAQEAALVVGNSEFGSESPSELSGNGNVLSEGAFTSQATANVTARAAALSNQGLSVPEVVAAVQEEASLEGGSLDAPANDPVFSPPPARIGSAWRVAATTPGTRE